ncbi:Protein regulator of cytokinesis 1 [Geodia barretti]|uniref:Protein regulator of cytokinesis 1 n=1 Tax=Geodia barretti TaxID=519541 RepID=A0AA35X146_GEOBA|nr:Protein regulator of cytokinesis 1 [Geodia barretti]
MSETKLRDLGPQMEALKAVLSDLLSSPMLEKFARVWQEMGVEDENLATRRDTIRLHIHNLMEDMYREEEVLKAKLIDSVAHCTKELAELCNQLSLPFEGPSDDLPLAAREKQLRQKADTLTKEKHSRLKRLKRLSELEVAMCHCLDETPKLTSILSSGQVPSEDELQHYRGLVGRLEKKKARINDRQAEFLALREKVLGLWNELEMEPHEQFEQQVASGDIRVFVLSSENLIRLNRFYAELEEEATHLEARAHQLRGTIRSLWERLEVPQDHRDAFSQLYTGHKPKIIASLCEEMSRLNELKKQHMQKFCEATREELHVVWDQCMYGPRQRREFSAAFTDEFSEDLLSAHESELDRMRGFYQDNKEIFDLLQKREKLWQQQIELDRQSNDPNRFNNRGGQLQKQLKLRKQLEKELPRTERELSGVVTQWEEDHERHFVVLDTRFLDLMEEQIEERSLKKETEKMKKKKDKEEALMFEMTYGSRPTTPVKRRGGTTPVSNISKQRRVGPSPLHSALRQQPSKKVNNTTTSQKRPTGLPTPGRKRPPTASSSRRILAEKNTHHEPCPDESLFTQANFSLASTGSYTDFQVETYRQKRTARWPGQPEVSQEQHTSQKLFYSEFGHKNMRHCVSFVSSPVSERRAARRTEWSGYSWHHRVPKVIERGKGISMNTRPAAPKLINFCQVSLTKHVECSSVCADDHHVDNLVVESGTSSFQSSPRGFRVEHFVRPPVHLDFSFLAPIDVACVVVKPDLGDEDSAATFTVSATAGSRSHTRHEDLLTMGRGSVRGKGALLLMKNRVFERRCGCSVDLGSFTGVVGSRLTGADRAAGREPTEDSLKDVCRNVRHLRLTVNYFSGPRPVSLELVEIWGKLGTSASEEDWQKALAALAKLEEKVPAVFTPREGVVLMYKADSRPTPECGLADYHLCEKSICHSPCPLDGKGREGSVKAAAFPLTVSGNESSELRCSSTQWDQRNFCAPKSKGLVTGSSE